jgi:hypothetical protein
MPGCRSFTASTAFRDLLVTQCCQPETFTDDVRFHFESVLRAGFEKAKQVLDDGSGCVVTVEVYKALAVDWLSVNKCGLLGVINEVAGVDA